jgi:purine-binding chemotaxis protein CheW
VSALYVVFNVGGADYILPAADVLQMETFSGTTPVPGAPPYVAGIVQVRGRVVPVVDLRVRLGLPAISTTLDSRIVLVESGGRTVALLADSAREVVKVAPEQIHEPPSMMSGDGTDGFVKSVANVDKRLLMLLDFIKVIGEDSTHVSER